MIKHFTVVANAFMALALVACTSASLSQTPAHRNSHDVSSQDEKQLARFEKQVDDVRTLLGIPGMSAAVIKDQKLIWAKGFGFADLEKRVAATPDTVFHLASLTKTFAATLIMQLAEQGKLNLDEPMSHYSSEFKNDSVKIKHLLSHTSEGTPGERYQYSGDQFERLLSPTAVSRQPYGLGWLVTDYHGLKLIWHYGHWGTGFSAIYLKVPEKNVSVVMLANSEALADHQFQAGEDIVAVFACNFLHEFVSEASQACERNSQTGLTKWIEQRRTSARKPIRLSPEILEAYAGQYQYEEPPKRIVTVTSEGDRLFANLPSGFRSELFAESESKFFLKIAKTEVVFVRDGKHVTHLEIRG